MLVEVRGPAEHPCLAFLGGTGEEHLCGVHVPLVIAPCEWPALAWT